MLVQTHWLISDQARRTVLDSAPSVVNRLGRMDFSARTGAIAWRYAFRTLLLSRSA